MPVRSGQRWRTGDLWTEVWRKVPGWALEVSNHARVRTLRGRPIKPTIERGKVWVRYTGSDDDAQAKRMFSLASMVLASFKGEPLNLSAKHIDGNFLNCRLENVEPDKLVYHASEGPKYFVEPKPEAVLECRRVLADADISGAVVNAVLSHREGHRTRQQWRDAEACIRALVNAKVATRTIADGMGLLIRVVTARREKMGLGAAPRVEPDRLPGERWLRIPGHKGKISNLGRYVGAFDSLVAGSVARGGRPRVKITPLDGSPVRTVMVASLVLGVWRGYPLSVPARHKNGDILDCRLKNLEVGMQGIRSCQKRGDSPWTRRQDKLLRKATTYAEAATLTGHTLAYARKRMRLLGIELQMPTGSRRGVSAGLEFRDLSALDQCVAVLRDTGVGDRDINLGLNIIKQGKGEFAIKNAAVDRCIAMLHGAGVPHSKIRQAVGLTLTTYHKRLRGLGVKTTPRRPEGWQTKAGPIDHREGEEWRTIPGLTHMVSSEGRVATADGWLIATIVNPRKGQRQVNITRPGGGRYTALVQKLVLAAFKPDMNSRQVHRLNGDLQDDRLENLVPSRVTASVSAPSQPRRRTGNLSDNAGLAMGSVPRAEPLWAQADALVPRGIDDHERGDLISEMVLLVMDGRANTMAEALKKARTAYNRMMGVWSETSLDTPLGDDGGSTRLDMLTSDAEFINTGQVRPRRS